MNDNRQLPDNTPIIVGSGQCVEFPEKAVATGLSSPMDLAAAACEKALDDAGVSAEAVDSIAAIRLFSDTVKTWASPFGGSNNPPQSIAARLGAMPIHRLYSYVGGNEPVQVMMELMQAISRGEQKMALLCGAEAIGNQRYALKNSIELDWSEEYDTPFEDRQYKKRLASPEEIQSGMTMPAHYYALIENAQAAAMNHSPEQHKAHMATMLAPFSAIAANNPYAQFPTAYTPAELAREGGSNYAISLPYSRRLIAQDAVNQSAAVLLTSAGTARELNIDPDKWIVVDAYAQGEDEVVTQRVDMRRSEAMAAVLASVLEQSDADARDFGFLDIYSCFPCAVQAVCDVLELPSDGSVALTVTGGLPFFGGPGNNYSMHALAEMARRLRTDSARALVTANGGQLTKHAVAVLRRANNGGNTVVDWGATELVDITLEAIATVPYAQNPEAGTVLTYTVIARRDKPDIGVVVAQDDKGGRFIASTTNEELTKNMSSQSPVGKTVRVIDSGECHVFEFAAS